MNDFNTFLITSTINTSHTQIDRDNRFRQTLQTFESIKKKDPHARILFCDSSLIPISNHEKNIIKSYVDLYVDYENNLFTTYLSEYEHRKSLNELLILDLLLRTAQKHNLIGKRVFKLSGRYQLKDSFDIQEYLNESYKGKFVFSTTVCMIGYHDGEIETKLFYITALWSMCSSCVEQYMELLKEMFLLVMNNENIEMAHNRTIPKHSLIIKDTMHGQGYLTNGQWFEF